MRCFTVMIGFAIACGPGARSGDDDGTSDSDASQGGGAAEACVEAATSKSYMACEYWAVDLDNAVEVLGSATTGLSCGQRFGQGTESTQRVCALGTAVAGLCDPPNDTCPNGYTCQQLAVCVLDAQHSPFAIVVSNPQTVPVSVTVTAGNGMSITQTIGAGEVKPIVPYQEGLPDQSLDGTGKTKQAYKVTSTLPIVAYQFNPLDNVDVFSNDASLLIPRSAFDTDYFAMIWPTLGRRQEIPSAHDYRGYLTIVAWQNGTRVEVTPTAPVLASATQPAIPANTATTFMLDAFETLNLEAQGPAGDLTGTRIRAVDGATTFGVFVGHEASAFGEPNPPDQHNTRGPCCADHLEEMVFPTSTWGKLFTIARSQVRTNENDVIRVLAQHPGTSVMFDPPPTAIMSGDCTGLGAGEYCTVRIMQDTALSANEPILVGHYLQSAIWNGGGNGTPPTTVGNGDPSMSIAVPTEQHRTDYTLLVPGQYEQNYVSIATGTMGTVTVDGTPVMLEAAPSGAFRVARIPLTEGQHTIKCPEHCGVEVYGYSDAVSYMFAAGLDLRPIVL